jgi:hypothetical protein
LPKRMICVNRSIMILGIETHTNNFFWFPIVRSLSKASIEKGCPTLRGGWWTTEFHFHLEKQNFQLSEKLSSNIKIEDNHYVFHWNIDPLSLRWKIEKRVRSERRYKQTCFKRSSKWWVDKWVKFAIPHSIIIKKIKSRCFEMKWKRSMSRGMNWIEQIVAGHLRSDAIDQFANIAHPSDSWFQYIPMPELAFWQNNVLSFRGKFW